MGAVKNMVKGFIFTGVYVVITILIPYFTFSIIYDVAGFYLEWSQQDYENIVFWLIAFGLITSGLAFFKYSSPKQSIRKGLFALLHVFVNCLYIWSYKFSGAFETTLVIVDYGFLSINLEQMVLISMGIYFLTIVIRIYDIIDFTINRDKIRQDRMKK